MGASVQLAPGARELWWYLAQVLAPPCLQPLRLLQNRGHHAAAWTEWANQQLPAQLMSAIEESTVEVSAVNEVWDPDAEGEMASSKQGKATAPCTALCLTVVWCLFTGKDAAAVVEWPQVAGGPDCAQQRRRDRWVH